MSSSPNMHSAVKLIHLSFYFLDKTMPDAVRMHIHALQTKNPDYKIIVWNPDTSRKLIATQFPQYLAMYDAFPHNIQRSDFSRYAILYTYGGMYMDTDYSLTQPVDAIWEWVATHFPQASAFVNESPNRFLKRRLSNSLMLSRAPRHPFWLHVLSCVTQGKGASTHERVMSSAGPQAIDRAFASYANSHKEVAVLPRQIFNPCSICMRGKCKATHSQTLAYHDHAGGWHNKSTRTLNALYCNAWWILGAFLFLLAMGVLVFFLVRCHQSKQCKGLCV